MDSHQFREFAKSAVDFIADYLENVRDRKVLPSIEPGFLEKSLASEAPQKGESWKDILNDMEEVIMPGMTHWQSPNFHAYFPAGNSYPSIVGEIISAGLGSLGFSWITSPICTELERMVMNWLAKIMDLPKNFLNDPESSGGGLIQVSASESSFICLLAAKEKTINQVLPSHPEWNENDVRNRLVAYSSDQANVMVEKAGLLASVPMRLLPSDKDGSLRASTLAAAMAKDREDGLIPCYVLATLGTTGACAFDNIEEIGPLCKSENVWLHIDAAYAGAAFVCPEFRYLMKGIEYADTFNFNPHKWMLVHFDCSALWFREAKYFVEAFTLNRDYLDHRYQHQVVDARHLQIHLGNRFRALKLWFVLRSYGAEGIRKFIRYQIQLTKYMEELIEKDDMFEVVFPAKMAMFCFRMKGDNNRTQALIDRLTERKNLYLISAEFKGVLFLRYSVCSFITNENDIDYSFKEIRSQACEVLLEEVRSNIKKCDSRAVVEKQLNGYSKCCNGENGIEKSK